MRVRSSIEPPQIELTPTHVFVASNIQPYTETIDGHTITGYEYDCTVYTKDEYLAVQTAQLTALQEELSAAKILLGVD